MSGSVIPSYNHWQLSVEKGCLVLSLDKQDSDTNTLDVAVLEEFAQLLDWLEKEIRAYRAIFLCSSKASGFIAGADIHTIQSIETAEKLRKLIGMVQTYFERFATLPVPKIALIDGYCMGGGLELALTCEYRIASRNSKLALPEVKLGLHPAFGGTGRLLSLLSPLQALPLMLQGNALSAQRAKQCGLVDEVVAEKSALLVAAHRLLERNIKPKRVGLFYKILAFAPLRRLLVGQIEKKLAKKASPAHYPAPYALLELYREHGANAQSMIAAEGDSFVRLWQTDASHALIRLYFLQERLKRFGKNEAEAIKQVHVVGAGTMGAGIAAWAAMQGIYTTLTDVSEQALAQAKKHAYQLFNKKLKDPDANRLAKMRFELDPEGKGAAQADLIIEAATEKLALKRELLEQLERVARHDAVLATNTSSLMLSAMAETLSEPRRLIGIHFFNPVEKMPLIEIVQGAQSSPADLARASKFAAQLRRLPLSVAESPGFLVNRILLPYLAEAFIALDEGYPAELIDKAATDFGMPIGPLALADTIGLDLCQSITASMREYLPDYESKQLNTLVAAGKLGKKTGEGIYVYAQGKQQKKSIENHQENLSRLSDRLIFAYLNACGWCMRKEIVADADLLDAGCVFGTGFAPFRGGPMHYAKQLGAAEVVAKLAALNAEYGERFQADAYWLELAEQS